MLLSMMASTGTMWGQTRSNATATLTQSALGLTGSYTTNTEKTIGGITYVYTDLMKNNNNIQAKASTGEIHNSTAYPGNIVSVAITHSGTARATTISGSPDGTNWTQIITGNGSITGDFTTGSYKYFKITRGSNAAYWTQIVITYSEGGGSAPSISANDVDIAYDVTSESIVYEIENYVAGTMAASTAADWISDFTYQQEDEIGEVGFTTTVNESVSPRSATVTLTYTYGAKSTVNKDVTVTQAGNPNAAGGANNPYTVAQARAAIDAGTSITGVYATGIVSQNVYYSGSNHYITYNISSDGLTTSDQLQAFHGRNLNNTGFASEDDIQVGDVVVIFGNLTKYNSTYEFADGNYLISLVRQPVITATPNPLAVPNYAVGTAEPEYETLTVNGSNLIANISVALNENSNFEMSTDLENWTNSLTLTQSEGSVTNAEVAIKLKAGLAKGNYAGTVTLTSTNAEDVVVNLSGTVTGQAYTIEQYSSPATAHGTITFEPASPVEDGTEVTLTATPADGYSFTADSWVFYKQSGQDYVVDNTIVVTNSKITMPAYNIWVDATFAVKPTYAITKVVTPANGGTVETDETAWEGKTVTVLVEAANGYAFSNLVISKTDAPETTIPTTGSAASGFTFTMPEYAVTATATFTETYTEGTFAKYTAEITEGYYVITYDYALKNVISSNRFANGVFSETDNIISNPDPSIVWYISPNGDYWTIYNDAVGKYAAGTNSKNQGALIENVTDLAKWTVTVSNGVFQFENLGRSNAASDSGNKWLRNNGNNGWACYASSTGGALTLYKMTTLTERTITFNGNGGTYNDETTYTQKVYDGIAANLTANQFTKANSEFAGWALTADGDVEYADQAAVTINADLGLFAKWLPLYTLTIDNNIDGGSVSIVGSITSAVEGTEITLSYSPTTGHAFSAWNVYKTGDPETIVTVTDNKFNMPAYNVTVSATFVEAKTYSLVTNVSQIVSGKHYIFASGTNGSVKVMAGQNDNNRTSVAVTATNGVIPETSGIYEFVINGPFTYDEKDCYTVYDTNVNSTGFLYAASSSSNYLRTKSGLDNNGKWTIEIATTGSEANIKAQGSNTRNWMRNNGSLFSCYGSGSSQADIYLFVKDNDKDYEFYGSEISYTETSIPADETITVGTGSVMTITSNSFTNNDPDNLIIEDGGQIIHDNAGVKATVKKSITGYGTGTGNYYLLVTPFTENIDPASVTNMIAATPTDYDLYQWNSGEAEEWRNYKQGTFTLNNGIGYLYANKNNVELTFTGTLKQSNEVVTVNPDYITADFGDWTLVGNPFPCDAYIIDANSSMAFYRMKSAGNGFETATGAIKPMEGIFVQTSEESQSFKFTREAPVTSPGKGNLNINVAQVVNSRDAQPVADNAIIRFDGGNNLKKFSFREDNTKVYIPQNGKDYAVVNAQAQGEMPVNFKAAENGTYTIDFSMDNVEFSYLHLIDNKTGMDIDLLQTSSYTFEASKIDYASRFKLVFSTNNNSNSNDYNSFAFFDANGNLMILGIEGTATLQVIDITGRAISNETFSGNYSKAINAKAGVYMLRLIQGNDVRTQKIVVR